MALHSYSGVGCVLAAPVDADGNLLGPYKRLGNVHPLTVQVETDTQNTISCQCDTAGQVLDTKTEITSTSGKMVLDQWDAKYLAWALMGEETPLNDAGGTVTDEAVTAPGEDEFVRLEHQRVSSVVVTDSTGTVTHVEGTDYLINSRLGMIGIIAGGAIASGDSLLVSYAFAPGSGYRVAIATRKSNRVALMGSLRNKYTGEEFNMELYKVSLTPDQEVTVISDPGNEGETLSFTLSLEVPPGKTTPGVIDGVPM